MDVVNSTIAGNSAGSNGGGIFNGGVSSALTLVNTIVADNVSGGDCASPPTSLGHNLDTDGTCGLGAGGDLSNVAPLLGTLANNGGPTETHALQPGSPAIDAGDDSAAPATDQRGVSRPQGPTSDIRAFELEAVITCNGLVPTILGTPAADVVEGTPGNDVIVAFDGDDVILGKGGDDTISAGLGDDLVHGGSDKDRVFGEEGNDTVVGGKGNDRLYGGPGADVLRGGKGHDRLYGEQGDDMLDGGVGNDKLFAGAGDDVALGRAGDDTIKCVPGFDFANGGPPLTDTASACESTINVP